MRLISVFIIALQVLISNLAVAENGHSTSLGELAVYPQRSAPATALSLNTTILSAQLQTLVSTINAQVSQAVKHGDVLLNLDCTDFELNHEMAKAQASAAKARLKLYQSQLTRTEEVYRKALVSQEDVDIRSTEVVAQNSLLKQRQVAVKLAELEVSRCTIKAPFNGVITSRLASIGQLTKIGDALLEIVDNENLSLSANVNYEDARLFETVSQFIFDFGMQVPVRIENLGGVINSQTRNQEIRFSFTGEKPLPGTAGKLLWTDPQPYLPPAFIVKRQGQLGIFIDDAGVARFIPLNQASPGRPTPVQLPLDTPIITENIALLQDGDLLGPAQ